MRRQRRGQRCPLSDADLDDQAALYKGPAVAAGKAQTRDGARHRRIARRRGKAKALVAVGNTQIWAYHALLSSPAGQRPPPKVAT